MANNCKVGVVITSTSGLSKSQAAKLGYEFLPITIISGEEQKLEGIDIDNTWGIKKSEEGKEMSTSQPSPGLIEELKKEWFKKYDKILIVCLSKGISSTYEMLKNTFKKDRNKVRIIDTNNTSVGEVVVARKLLEKINSGVTDIEKLHAFGDDLKSKFKIYIIPANLKTLKKGGRITPAAAALGDLLAIKPILQMNNNIDKAGKGRGVKKAYRKALKMIEKYKGTPNELYVVDFAGGEHIDLAIEMAEKVLEIKPTTEKLSSVIGSHVGLGTVAYAAFWND